MRLLCRLSTSPFLLQTNARNNERTTEVNTPTHVDELDVGPARTLETSAQPKQMAIRIERQY